MHASTQEPVANGLLMALPRNDYLRMAEHLQPVELNCGEVLYEPGKPIREVYFPGESFVSLLTQVEGHRALEVGIIGREGMVGVPLGLGVANPAERALVQGSGRALKMGAPRFRKHLELSAALRQALHSYTYALMAQITQSAACNLFHVVEARLARRLLITRDDLRSAEFRLTHEFLGHMLGVRRVGVTQAASALQRRKLIEYSRGHIRILNDAGLEGASCACYRLTKAVRERAARALP